MLGPAAPGDAAASGHDKAHHEVDCELVDQNNSAIIIQRHWRGYQTRKALEQLNVNTPEECQQQSPAGNRLQDGRDHLHPGNVQLSRPPIPTGVTPDVWNATSGVLIRNRGALRAAACIKGGLPLLSPVTGTFCEVQLGVSLYNEALGTFYGNTCYSQLDPPQQQILQEAAAAAETMECCINVYFHSCIADPHCMAVVEVILVQHEANGMFQGRSSMGWAQLPLFSASTKATAGSASQLLGSPAAIEPVMAGTPRYLLFRSVCGDDLAPPAMLPGCQVEAYPALDIARALLPCDFLVCQSDVIPGLRRSDSTGRPTTGLKNIITTLAAPVLAPLVPVKLADLKVQVPQKLHNLLSILPQLTAHGKAMPLEAPALLAAPSQPSAVAYYLRIGQHNGRIFVGQQLSTGRLEAQRSTGSVLLCPSQRTCQHLKLDCLLADELLVLVAELLAAPVSTAVDAQGALVVTQAAPAVLVGRAVLSPFEQVAADGTSATLAAGMHRRPLNSNICSGCSTCSGCCPVGLLGCASVGMLPLNWRALLGDVAYRALPDPQLQLQLLPSGRAPVKPQMAASICAAVPASLAGPSASNAGVAVAAAGSSALTVVSAARQPAAEAAVTLLREVHDTPAAKSLKLAAKHLQEAASIPVRERTAAGSVPPGPSAKTAMKDASHRQQLHDLTRSMQLQVSCLAKAVQELQEERHNIRSSLTLLQSAVHPAREPVEAGVHPPGMPAALEAAAHSSGSNPQVGRATSGDIGNTRPASPDALHRSNIIAPDELESLKALGATEPLTDSGDLAGFSGAQAAAAAAAAGSAIKASRGQPLPPSRAVMQQLHEAGMVPALPVDFQALLRRSVAAPSSAGTGWQGRPAGVSALMLEAEARDPRTASDLVLQLLAFRPTAAPAAAGKLPTALKSMYFTLHFYSFGPTITETCLLVPGAPASQREYPLGDNADKTFLLMPEEQGRHSGAGLVLKYHLDTSSSDRLPGQDPGSAAFEGHMALCRYLATHTLTVDAWDGDSLLQLGSCAIPLQGLLRQGHEFAELLLEVPVVQTCQVLPSEEDIAVAAAAAGRDQGSSTELGQLVIRLINIAKQPSNAAAQTPDFDAAEMEGSGSRAGGKRVRVRAAPLQPGSPVAMELRGKHSQALSKQQQPRYGWPDDDRGRRHRGDGDGAMGQIGLADGCSNAPSAPSSEAGDTAADIIGFEQRKVAREQQLQQILSDPRRPGSAPGVLQHAAQPGPLRSMGHSQLQSPSSRPASPLPGKTGADPLQAVQKQLLADVDAVRKRQKATFIRSQLRKGLVTQCTLQPSLGQTLLLHHVLENVIGRDAVFEVRISQPQQLQALESMHEYRELHQAAGSALVATSPAAAVDSSLYAGAGGVGSEAAGKSAWPSLAGLVTATTHQAAAGQLLTRGKIFVAAHERVLIPFKFRLPDDSMTCQQPASNSHHIGQQQGPSQQAADIVTVEFIPTDLNYPVSILELQIKPRPLIIDRTLRYHCPERHVLRAGVPLASQPGTAQQLLKAAAAGSLVAAASLPGVTVSVSFTHRGTAAAVGGRGSKGTLGQVSIKYKTGMSPEVVQFLVWLYGDGSMAQPLEVWQVFVHALRKVDMRAVTGQSCSTSLAVGGGMADRQVAAFSSHPLDLQPFPQQLTLPAGGVSALSLVFRPLEPGQEWIRVHLVDASKTLIHAFIVATEATPPSIRQRVEIDLQAGTLGQRQLAYSNPYSHQPRIFSVTTNKPWLLSCQPCVLELPPRATRPLQLVLDGRALQPGDVQQALLFVNDEDDRSEECIEVVVNVLPAQSPLGLTGI
eukprot:gene6048-6286_t